MCSTEANVETCWHYIKLFVELTLAFLISFALCNNLTSSAIKLDIFQLLSRHLIFNHAS